MPDDPPPPPPPPPPAEPEPEPDHEHAQISPWVAGIGALVLILIASTAPRSTIRVEPK